VGNRLNGFQILAFALFTWLKPGVNETGWKRRSVKHLFVKTIRKLDAY
jgi:hypothetical protein